VAVVDGNGEVTVKLVTIARDEGSTVTVSGGVSVYDQVVDSPPDSIRSRDRVNVQREAAGARKSAANAH
jgi:hypothetical protein